MSDFHDSITDKFAEWIAEQHIFFVGSAPLSAEGRVNLSPKGLDAFRVLSPHKVAYLDLTGSGNETSAHLKENGRITFMFCSFEKAPRILRLYGQGRVILSGDAEWDELKSLYPNYSGVRQIVVADIHSVQTSCGFAVPFMEYVGEREALLRHWDKKGENGGVSQYHQEKNQVSIDGLPTHLCDE